jgi:NAD(P)-dependent dehydrogenase (short-subunit alcohol dehydrogenase family)
MPQKPTVLVTGANRGIGLAIVERFAREGFPVWLGARDAKAGASEAARLRAAGFDVSALTLDVADPASIDAALADLKAKHAAIGVLVNNAGILPEGTLLEMPEPDIEASFAVHVFGPIRLIRALTPGMVAQGRGRIVNMSSGWGSFAQGLGPGAYGVSKAALNALTVRFAEELPKVVKCNVMCPGWVRSRMGGAAAPVAPETAAETAFWLGTLPDNGPTGKFFRDRKEVPW